MSDEPHIDYLPRRDATPEAEAAALAAVYRFLLLDGHENAAGCDQHRDGDDTKVRSSSDDSRAGKASIPR